PEFRQKMTDRWAILRTNVLNGDRLTNHIDEIANYLTESAGRNYNRYAGLLNSYTWPEPEGGTWDVDYTQPTYVLIISEMKKWTKGRYVWMDSQFLGTPIVSQTPGHVSPGVNLQLASPAPTIYYTLNGTDPRLPGGAIAPGALAYS